MHRAEISEPPGFDQLSKAEQIRYLQALWDRIASKPADIPVPVEHLDLVEQRLASYRVDPSGVSPASDVFDRLKNRPR